MNRCKLIPDPHALDGGMLLHCGPIIPELPRIERAFRVLSVRLGETARVRIMKTMMMSRKKSARTKSTTMTFVWSFRSSFVAEEKGLKIKRLFCTVDMSGT